MVSISTINGGTYTINEAFACYVDGVIIIFTGSSKDQRRQNATFIVPKGSSYLIDMTLYESQDISVWAELR